MLNTSYALDAYRSRDLSISMKTSSGDTINMGFSNQSSLSMNTQQNQNGTKSEFSFSSMQAFSFSFETNGIDEQDKKEIEAFMKVAQPYIDSFLDELKQDTPKSPINKIAKDIADAFAPMKQKDENTQNFTKSNIAQMFENSLKKLEPPKKENKSDLMENIFENAKKLLEKTLKEFDELHKNIYA